MTALIVSLLFAAPLVEVTSVIDDAVVELKYATADNFMKQQVYPSDARCLLHADAVKALQKAAHQLRAQGFRLLLYDCYRPRSVQFILWKAFPKPGFVANPKVGSIHSRAGAVDISLLTLDGAPVEMPTAYDAFTREAHHSADNVTAAAKRNRAVLKAAMLSAGFTLNPKEWWHYDAPNSKTWPLRDEPVNR
jgi:zinc D-Ala-D-Ala dipeptidase